jgi:CBS-domain-containing membrane protein
MSRSAHFLALMSHRLHNAGLVMLAVGILALIAHLSHEPLLMAPFAPSILAILTQPRNPHVAPNVLIAAYIVATVIAVLLKSILPMEWWGVAIAVGLAMLALEALDILHPPAVAMPILVMMGNGDFPLPAFTIGVVTLAGLSIIGRRLPRRAERPAVTPSVQPAE